MKTILKKNIQKKLELSKKKAIEKSSRPIFIETKYYNQLKKENYAKFSILVTESIENIRPYVSVRKARRRRRTFYYPYIALEDESRQIAIKWIKESVFQKRKPLKSSAKGFAESLFESYLKSGYGWQKKEELHKLVMANKTFARFRWW